MQSLIVIGIIVLLIFVIFLTGKAEEKKTKAKFRNKLKVLYGKQTDQKVSVPIQALEAAVKYHESKGLCYEIDDITFYDLDMDQLFREIDYCQSIAGKEALFSILKRPLLDEQLVKERQNHIAYFDHNEDDRLDYLMFMYECGIIKSNHLELFFHELHKESSHLLFWVDVLTDVCMIMSLILGLFYQSFFIVIFACLLLFAICNYLNRKNKIIDDFKIFGYFNRLIEQCSQIKKLSKSLRDEFCQEFNKIDDVLKNIKRKRSVASLFFSNSNKATGEDFLRIIFLYINMIFHFDLMYYQIYLGFVLKNEEHLKSFMKILGEIEAYVSISYYKEYKKNYAGICEPIFVEKGYKASELYHPLIDNPVKNSISQNRGMLLTGSNASGKSTFLKTVALNAIFAQAFGFVCAESYEATLSRVYSSMALRDNIKSGESYFVVEVKAMKRLFDQAEQEEYKEYPLLCTIDEILRGTNTAERIGASTELLLALSEKNVLCFAATHDHELTDFLKDSYDNYHFEEIVEEKEVSFPYIIKEGPATSRNAIKLLQIMGFDERIVEKSNERAKML